MLLFGVVATLCVTLSNQRVGVEEDRINKPWRPLPSGRISLREARTMALVAWSVLLAVSVVQDMLAPALGLFIADAFRNHLGGDRHWSQKNGWNAVAHASLFLAAIAAAGPAAAPAATG